MSEDKKKMCPILTAAAYAKIAIGHWVSCEGADCAWWQKGGTGCSIPAIVEAIGNIKLIQKS